MTRHNLGFMVLDELTKDADVRFKPMGDGEVVEWSVSGRHALLAKPMTFVNRSGEYVRYLLSRYTVDVDNILVVHDDVSLELSQYKFKFGGGDLGHNGLVSIITELGESEFYRLRIGIGHPKPGESRVDWVLSPVPEEQGDVLCEVLNRCSGAVRDFVRSGGVAAMNMYNKRNRERGKPFEGV